MRTLLTSLARVLGLGAAERGDVLTPAQFQDEVVAEICQRLPEATIIKLGERQLEIRAPGHADPTTLNLERVYALYESEPADLKRFLEGISTGFEPQPEPAPEALLVLVRPATFEFASETDALLSRPLSGGLSAVVVLDQPTRYAMVSASKLRAELKMDDAALWATALSNTRQKLNLEPGRLSPGQPTEFTTGQGLAASLLALDDFWDAPQLTAHGPLVVEVLARDYVYVAALSDRPAVQRMRKSIGMVQNDPNGLTNDLLVRRDGRWETLG